MSELMKLQRFQTKDSHRNTILATYIKKIIVYNYE